MFVLVLSGR